MTAEFYMGVAVGFLACPLICAGVLWHLMRRDLRNQQAADVPSLGQPEHA